MFFCNFTKKDKKYLVRPVQKIKNFAASVEKLVVVEELDPIIENHCRQLGLAVTGKDAFSMMGEFSQNLVAEKIGMPVPTGTSLEDVIPPRPPVMCAGCPHRGLFYTLKKNKLTVLGDIGCYTLGAGQPLCAMDTTLCMGASISMGHGAQKVYNKAGIKRKVVTVLGDSTFFHTGVNSLMNTVYNNSNTINVILDNRITGMTGHQQNPGTGYTVKGEEANMIDMETLVRAIGIKHVKVIDPNNLKEVDEAFDAFWDLDEPSVIITRYPCVLKKFSPADLEQFPGLFQTKNVVDAEKCIGCKLCQKTGCPALIFDKNTDKG